MAVVKGDRSKTSERLETAELLRNLCVYTIQVTKNEKNFPKRDRWVLTQHIVNEAVKAYTHARKANAVEVVTMSDYKIRRRHQVKCRGCLEALLSLIEVAYTVLNLEAGRVEYWAQFVDKCEKMLAAWRASDRKRYRAKLKAKGHGEGNTAPKGDTPGEQL